jgi:uncharacterized membrane protein (DUF373 family)
MHIRPQFAASKVNKNFSIFSDSYLWIFCLRSNLQTEKDLWMSTNATVAYLNYRGFNIRLLQRFLFLLLLEIFKSFHSEVRSIPP